MTCLVSFCCPSACVRIRLRKCRSPGILICALPALQRRCCAAADETRSLRTARSQGYGAGLGAKVPVLTITMLLLVIITAYQVYEYSVQVARNTNTPETSNLENFCAPTCSPDVGRILSLALIEPQEPKQEIEAWVKVAMADVTHSPRARLRIARAAIGQHTSACLPPSWAYCMSSPRQGMSEPSANSACHGRSSIRSVDFWAEPFTKGPHNTANGACALCGIL